MYHVPALLQTDDYALAIIRCIERKMEPRASLTRGSTPGCGGTTCWDWRLRGAIEHF